MSQPVSASDANDALIYRDGILDYEAHDALLRALGYEYLALPCNCGGSEEDGHLPTCGWGRREKPSQPECPECDELRREVEHWKAEAEAFRQTAVTLQKQRAADESELCAARNAANQSEAGVA